VQYFNVKNLTGLGVSYLSSFLGFIPARLGINKVLDSIVECLCTTYCQIGLKTARFARMMPRKYSKALDFLWMSLHNERKTLSSEVLCSVVLFSCHEVMAILASLTAAIDRF